MARSAPPVDRQSRLQQVIPGEMFEDDVMEWLRLV